MSYRFPSNGNNGGDHATEDSPLDPQNDPQRPETSRRRSSRYIGTRTFDITNQARPNAAVGRLFGGKFPYSKSLEHDFKD